MQLYFVYFNFAIFTTFCQLFQENFIILALTIGANNISTYIDQDPNIDPDQYLDLDPNKDPDPYHLDPDLYYLDQDSYLYSTGSISMYIDQAPYIKIRIYIYKDQDPDHNRSGSISL